jgi:diguanylate cyclase (GGDEF)-like protein
MIDLYEEHVAITAEIKKEVEPLKVLFPAQYGHLYSLLAQKHDLELKPEQLLNPEMLDEQMIRHIITLTACTETAIEAIEMQDTAKLQAILHETKLLREEIQELRKVVYEDNLTHTYNRKWFDDILLDADGITMQKEGILVLIDLNKFKRINDTYGHITGDKVLILVAKKLKSTGGNVVRYGGDEFVLLFPHDEKNVLEKIEEVLNYFQHTHFSVEKETFKIDFAYGVSPFLKGANRNRVIEKADEAMYRNKKSL